MEKDKIIYPHIEMPWMKYYDKSLVNDSLPKETIYQFMKNGVIKNINNTITTYYGKEVKGEEFLRNVDLAAGVLREVGINQQNRIMYLIPNIPEAAHLFYAGSKIGSVSDYVDPRPDSINPEISSQKLLKMITNEKIKMLVIFESCYLSMIKPIESQLKDLNINTVITISPDELLTAQQQLYYTNESIKFYGLRATLKKLKFMREYTEKTREEMKKSPLEILSYANLKKECERIKVQEAPYEPDSLAVITHSSGTTSSFPKTIPLHNEGINSYAFQVRRSRVNTSDGDRVLHILPYFSAYGVGVTHMGFSSADNMIQIPEFSPNCMGKLIKKYKPNVIMGTPNWYLSLPKDKVLAKSDLSFMKVIGFGGDSMNPYDEIEINEFLKKHNCKELLTKGHGMSETSGGSSYAANEYNVPGSMGIPLIDTIYGVVDPETRKPIGFKEGEDRITGELIISSPAIVDSTIDDRKVIEHGTIDGKDFIYTKDIAAMDRNGVLYFLSRNDRSFPRYDGFKVKPYEIEKHIKALPFIKDCIISPYEDVEKFGKMIRADIILKEEFINDDISLKSIVETIIEKAFTNNSNVSTRQIPTKFVFRNEFPITINNKVDYNSLIKESMPEDAISVIIDEPNVSVSGIRIIEPQIKKLTKK